MIVIGGKGYELVADHKDGWNPEAFRGRYSEILDRYDYIVGDWGYSQLRLKGFYRDNHPKANRDTSISGLMDYINEYCNFGCAYFVLQKLKEAPVGPDILIKEPAGAEPGIGAAAAPEAAIRAEIPRDLLSRQAAAQISASRETPVRELREHITKERPHKDRSREQRGSQGGAGRSGNKSAPPARGSQGGMRPPRGQGQPGGGPGQQNPRQGQEPPTTGGQAGPGPEGAAAGNRKPFQRRSGGQDPQREPKKRPPHPGAGSREGSREASGAAGAPGAGERPGGRERGERSKPAGGGDAASQNRPRTPETPGSPE
ncbi:DUF1027 domain-containing protein [Paenibacillus spiritus]|uniref:DUF1027 domain-containing protein n=1 Tax=Paenibacillus spiritus TaxID=2496557 RepID=A0A5J5GLX5_9BACL|nr:YutD family protein [Paenibacillus spiritus]KAA9008643.1 DUF1027 domain-containing protein [Paenibacillus spiritus]